MREVPVGPPPGGRATPGQHPGIVIGLRLRRIVRLTKYVCTDCGYIEEEWVNSKENLVCLHATTKGRRLMSTPHQEIKCFLTLSRTEPNLALEVALEFARCMCEELRTTLTQWEVETEALQETKAVRASARDN